jgi:two-component system sensor histidine kinase AlgZ
MQAFLQRHRVLLVHLSFWGVYLSFTLYQITVFQRHDRERGLDWPILLTSVGIQLFFTALIAYFNYFVTQPRFLKHQNIWRYLFEFCIPFALLIAARVYIQRLLIDGYTHKGGYFYSDFFIVQITAVTFLIAIFVGMLRFAIEWFEFDAKKKAVENEKLTAELNFLKAQINPHFLFNTLNNLYYLAYSQSPNTTEVIAKLSQMMRYMIYDTNQPKVPLSKEIEYMQNYISLERLRLNNQIPIDFTIHGNIDDVWITPLVLITFLENAFKHGVTNTSKDSWVKVHIDVKGQACVFTVENSKAAKTTTENGEKSGIGLQNVQRRLALSYPERHRLTVDESDNHYAIELNLVLS